MGEIKHTINGITKPRELPERLQHGEKDSPERGKEAIGGLQQEKKERVQAVLYHMFLNLVVLCIPFQFRTLYVLKLAGNNSVKCGTWVSYMSALAGLVEFFLNPVLGRLSDAIGRKPFLIASPLVNLVTKLAVFWSDGKSLLLVALDRIVGGAMTTVGGTTACSAAIRDVVQGDELAGGLGEHVAHLILLLVESTLC